MHARPLAARCTCSLSAPRTSRRFSAMSSAHEFSCKDIKGAPLAMKDVIGGKVALLVNTASQCGFTPQYKGLQELQDKFKDRGFTVVGFPCNQFGGQESGTEAEIEAFTCTKFKTTFPLTSKVEVNGPGAHPLWTWLKKERPGFMGFEGVKWNFSKFLVDAEGKVVERYAPTTSPEAIAKDIAKLLK